MCIFPPAGERAAVERGVRWGSGLERGDWHETPPVVDIVAEVDEGLRRMFILDMPQLGVT